MITLIIILIYILTIFINRQVNKWLYNVDNNYPIWVGIWFLPIIPSLTMIWIICEEKYFKGNEEKSNWFNGKNW